MSTDNKDDVIAQIQRIMRLYNRAGTEGEKSAASAAMKRLAVKHGIDLEEIKATESDARAETYLDSEFKNIPVMEMGYISAVLRQHFGIILIQHRNGQKVKFEWVGTRINIEIAKHVTYILLRAVQKDWRTVRLMKATAKGLLNYPSNYYRDPKKERNLVQLASVKKRAFMDGWFWTIHQKLNEHPLRNDREQLDAERKAAEEMLEKIKKEKSINEKKDSGRAMDEEDRKAVMLGYEAAKALNLSRPCEGSSSSPLALR